jgi:hypothetical protein
MSSVTGIEIGPDGCVLVSAALRGLQPTVSTARVVTPAEWSDDPERLAGVLRLLRRTNRLPNRARVVAWAAASTPKQVGVAEVPVLQAFIAAGFEIGSVISPAQALARVVRGRRATSTAVAAVSLNSHGSALAIVRGDEVLYSRVFEWALGKPFTASRPELLERYLLISQLAPHLQHAIQLVRPVHGVAVTSAVACGNLRALRSLTMALIEEMDIEVETLDSPDLLDPNQPLRARLTDSVAALQLAAAAASFEESHSPIEFRDVTRTQAAATLEDLPPTIAERSITPPLIRAGAVAALVLGAAWSVLRLAAPLPAISIVTAQARAQFESSRAAEAPRPPASSDAMAPASSPMSQAADVSSADRPSSARLPVPEPRTEATMGRVSPTAGASGSAGLDRDAPVPEVDGIIVSGERRIAIVGGAVVSEGDRVGPRAVARIERDGVVLRELSGREMFVPVRMRRFTSAVRERL